ncbi:MAG: M1 family peptidase, partial [Cytophagaceae bacterium]
MQKIVLLVASLAIPLGLVQAQAPTQHANTRFEQLGPILPTPNTFRTASGAPGKDYFQNRADYDIKATLDDTKQKITGSETITYHN